MHYALHVGAVVSIQGILLTARAVQLFLSFASLVYRRPAGSYRLLLVWTKSKVGVDKPPQTYLDTKILWIETVREGFMVNY